MSLIETSGVGEINDFKMLVNEKSFSIIISGIYSDKIKAIIREYGCNAVDSHKMAGHAKPFDVHLPSYDNPIFYVRDYGVGLDEEDIINVFTVAFASTKEKTSLTTGELGIGGMSGFCYNTASFTVTSWKNGVKYVYHCFLNGGVPSYTKLLEEPSGEPTGVKVEMAAGSDAYAFSTKSKEVFSWFSIKPNFVGDNRPTLEDINPSINNDRWMLYGRKCYVWMGDVLYEVEAGHQALEKYQKIIYSGVIIKAPVGSVDFQPSRERLQYTAKTVSFLLKAFENVAGDVVKIFEDGIKNSHSLWNASVNFQKLYNGELKEFSSILDGDITWNGSKLKKGGIITANDLKNIQYQGYSKRRWSSGIRTTSIPDIQCDPNHTIIVNDLKRGIVGRTKKYIAENGGTAHTFTPQNDETVDSVKQYLYTILDCCEKDIMMASELPELDRNVVNRDRLTTVSKWSGPFSATRAWKSVDLSGVDITKGKYYYVERSAYRYLDDGNKRLPSELKDVKSTLDRHDKITKGEIVIYGVATKEIKNLPKNWVEATKEARRINSKYIDVVKQYIIDLDYYYNIKRRYNYSKQTTLTLIKKVAQKLDKDHNIVKWIGHQEDLLNIPMPNKPSSYSDVINMIDETRLQYITPDFKDELIEDYKLLTELYHSSESVLLSDHFLLYVLGVDNHGKNLQ